MAEYDPFALTTGLPDDFDGEVSDAWFGYDTQYMQGQAPLLILELVSDSLEAPVRSLYGIGDNWEIDRQPHGEQLIRENGVPNFNVSSGVGALIKSFIGMGQIDALRSRGIDPTNAACWRGMFCHWLRQTETYTFKGEKREVTRLLPTVFHGFVGEENTAQPAPVVENPVTPTRPTPTTTAPATSRGVVPRTANPTGATVVTAPSNGATAAEITRQQRGRLLAFATESEYASVESFIEAVRASGEFADVSDVALMSGAPAIFASAS